MKPKTMILMVVAVGCGLGASYMTSKLLADRNVKPQEVQTVPVLVAKVRVPGWQPIKEPEKMFEVKMFPVDVAPKRALGNLADLKDQRLNKPLDETKAVTQDDLLTKEQQTLTDQLQPGQRAVAIKVTTEGIVGGFVLPGSRVDVICTTRGSEASSKVVLQNMLVLAVDTQKDRNPEQQSIIAQTVTVAATPVEATRLALASEIGQLRLSLKNQGDTSTVEHIVVKASDLNKPLGETDAGSKSEAAPVAAAPMPVSPLPVLPADDKGPKVEDPPVVAPPAPRPRRRHVMTIQNGTQREKATFVEGPEEDVASSEAAAPPPAENTRDDRKEERPAADKAKADKPAAPAPAAPAAGGSAFGPKTNRAKRIQ
ncbi:MAG: Flp pilus assembly protein CpaB [Gemmataceae bacterium]